MLSVDFETIDSLGHAFQRINKRIDVGLASMNAQLALPLTTLNAVSTDRNYVGLASIVQLSDDLFTWLTKPNRPA